MFFPFILWDYFWHWKLIQNCNTPSPRKLNLGRIHISVQLLTPNIAQTREHFGKISSHLFQQQKEGVHPSKNITIHCKIVITAQLHSHSHRKCSFVVRGTKCTFVHQRDDDNERAHTPSPTSPLWHSRPLLTSPVNELFFWSSSQ